MSLAITRRGAMLGMLTAVAALILAVGSCGPSGDDGSGNWRKDGMSATR